MTNEQIAEKVLQDVFNRAASGRPADVIPLAVFAAVTAHVALQVLPDNLRMEINRQVMEINRMCDDKVIERNKAHNLVTGPQA